MKRFTPALALAILFLLCVGIAAHAQKDIVGDPPLPGIYLPAVMKR